MRRAVVEGVTLPGSRWAMVHNAQVATANYSPAPAEIRSNALGPVTRPNMAAVGTIVWLGSEQLTLAAATCTVADSLRCCTYATAQ